MIKWAIYVALALGFAACDMAVNKGAPMARKALSSEAAMPAASGGVCDDPTWKCGRHGGS